MGGLGTGRFSQLPALPRAPQLEPGSDPASFLGAAFVLQIPDLRRCGRFVAHQEPGFAQNGKAVAPIPYRPTDARLVESTAERTGSAQERPQKANRHERVLPGCGDPGNDLFLRVAY